MIPEYLQNDLKERLESLFNGQLFDNPDSERVPLKIYKQHLPIIDSDEEKSDELSLYPYILIKLREGTQESWDAKLKTTIDLVVGVFNEDKERKGYQDVVGTLQKMQADFLSKPHMDNQFSLVSPPNWMLHDEDLHPFYFGAMELNFEQEINIQRKDVSHLL